MFFSQALQSQDIKVHDVTGKWREYSNGDCWTTEAQTGVEHGAMYLTMPMCCKAI